MDPLDIMAVGLGIFIALAIFGLAFLFWEDRQGKNN